MEDINAILNYKLKFESAPADLCLKCGKCCKTIITGLSNEELTYLANTNDCGAKVFFEIFKRYENIEDVFKVNKEHAERVIKSLRKNKKIKDNNVTFYYCPWQSPDNLCKIYSRRPECCRRAPLNGWALFPSGCGYEGWQFEQREKIKGQVRKIRELLYELEIVGNIENNKIPTMTNSELKEKLRNKLKEYVLFGAEQQ